MPSATRTDLRAIRNMISEADLLITTTVELPEGRSIRAHELLSAAMRVADQLLITVKERKPAAAVLGAKGGQRTAERGPEYYRKIAAMRKTRAGGRPKNMPE